MLAVSPLRDTIKDERQGEAESTFGCGGGDGLPDLGDSNLLDSIDFDDLFIGIGDGDVLPDLEMDPEILADFSVSSAEDYSDVNTAVFDEKPAYAADKNSTKLDEDDKVSGSDSGSGLINSSPSGEEIVSKRDDRVEGVAVNPTPTSTPAKDGDKSGRKASSAAAQLKNSQGKRKVKVDWTPELHRRFVQAVEQLGVDKAVPSRILEIMGIDCLTRHNIASHLQKYRSHRKHLLAREAEAASWSQRRQIYGTVAVAAKRDLSLWTAAAPTMGFPPMTPPPPPPPPVHHFRPLHVWGHPTVDMHVWPPKHVVHSPNPPPPPPPQAAWPPDPSYGWHSPHHQRVTNALTPGTPCFPQPLAAAPTLTGSPGAGIYPAVATQPHGMYKVDNSSHPKPQAPNSSISTTTPQSAPGPHPLFDFLPSKESIDAAIEDVLAKPWLPLPLGLKPPSTDSVMVELQRQGVPNVPPSCA